MLSRTDSRVGRSAGPGAALAQLRQQLFVVVARDVVDADEDSRTEPFLDVGNDRELASEELAEADLVEPQADQLGAKGLFRRKARTRLFHLDVEARERQSFEAEAVDLVQAQPLLDQEVERSAAPGGKALAGGGRKEPQPHDALDVRVQDRIFVDDRHDTIDQHRRLGGGGRSARGERQDGAEE